MHGPLTVKWVQHCKKSKIICAERIKQLPQNPHSIAPKYCPSVEQKHSWNIKSSSEFRIHGIVWNWQFIIMFKRFRLLLPFWARWVHSTSTHPLPLRWILTPYFFQVNLNIIYPLIFWLNNFSLSLYISKPYFI